MREFKTDKEFKAGEIVTEKDIKKPKKVLKLAFYKGYVQQPGIDGFNICPVCGETEGFCFNGVERNRVELTNKWDIELSFDCSNCAPRGGILKTDAEYLSVEMVNVERVESYQIIKYTQCRVLKYDNTKETKLNEEILYDTSSEGIRDIFWKILCNETVDREGVDYRRRDVKKWKIAE